mmetsp:Transcript_16032/g.34743  ORF Transcript_16032/g.34743 Transcript_16032/m.34743 type:complete len:122 (-) Transcript_16032:252-617(-)
MSGSPRTSNSQTSAFTLPWKDPRCEEQEQQQSRDYHHQQQQQQQQEHHPLYNRCFPPSHAASGAFYQNQSIHPNMDDFRHLVELRSVCGSESENSEQTLKRKNTSAKHQWESLLEQKRNIE